MVENKLLPEVHRKEEREVDCSLIEDGFADLESETNDENWRDNLDHLKEEGNDGGDLLLEVQERVNDKKYHFGVD